MSINSSSLFDLKLQRGTAMFAMRRCIPTTARSFSTAPVPAAKPKSSPDAIEKNASHQPYSEPTIEDLKMWDQVLLPGKVSRMPRCFFRIVTASANSGIALVEISWIL